MFERMKHTKRSTTNIDSDERVIGHDRSEERRETTECRSVKAVGTCRGCHDNSMTLDRGVLFAMSMTAGIDDRLCLFR